MKKMTTLFVLCVSALLAYDCEKVSLDDYQEFVMTTPDVGNLTFETLNAIFQDDEYYVSAMTGRKQSWDDLWLTLSFNKGTSIGSKIKVNNCFFGIMTNAPYTNMLSSGQIYLKAKTENSISLRFINVRFTTDRGDYRLNGDLSFSINRHFCVMGREDDEEV